MVLKKTQGYINLHCKFTIDIRVEIKVKKNQNQIIHKVLCRRLLVLISGIALIRGQNTKNIPCLIKNKSNSKIILELNGEKHIFLFIDISINKI